MPLFNIQVARLRTASRLKGIRRNTRELAAAMKMGDVIAARLAAIRLQVWAEAVKEVLGQEVELYLADLRR